MSEVLIEVAQRKIKNPTALKDLFLGLKDGKYQVTIKDMRKRSLPQNAYYWGVMVPMVLQGLKDAGFDDVTTNDEAHEIIKHVVLRKRIVSKETGETIDIAGSTKKLTIPEFSEYIEKVCKWSAEYLGVVIPSPNEEMVMFNENVFN